MDEMTRSRLFTLEPWREIVTQFIEMAIDRQILICDHIVDFLFASGVRSSVEVATYVTIFNSNREWQKHALARLIRYARSSVCFVLLSGYINNSHIAVHSGKLSTHFLPRFSLALGNFFRHLEKTDSAKLQQTQNKGQFVNMTHRGEWRIFASINYGIIGSDDGLSPVRRQAIIWTNDG